MCNANACTLPTELLVCIFRFLPGNQLFRCREVCNRWKQIVDDLAETESLWRDLCKIDHGDVYREARRKASLSLSWRYLYKSLHSWPNLKFTERKSRECALWTKYGDEINGIHVENGTIAVHKIASINYYDSKTLEQTNVISGNYRRYEENEFVIVLMHYVAHEDRERFPPGHSVYLRRDSLLRIIPKEKEMPKFENVIKIDDVDDFILVDRQVFYVQSRREIHVCKFSDDFKCTFLNTIDDYVNALSYSNNHLNILTKKCKIYTLTEQDLALSQTINASSNFFHQLMEYNFIVRFDHELWSMYYVWVRIFNHIRRPSGLIQNITAMRIYGDVVLVGNIHGVLRIYYAPFKSGELDLINMKPVEEHDLKKLFILPDSASATYVNGIDVIETDKGHMVIASIGCKIVILEFNQNVLNIM